MKLCTYSKSAILSDLILPDCPLGLQQKFAKKCPCRKREYNVPPCDLRVLSCVFPDNWKGEAIVNPEGVATRLGQKKKIQKPRKEAAVTATATANESAEATEQPLWGEVNGRDLKIPIIGVTGDKGSGKTLFISTISTEKTGMVDLEDSSVSYNLPFARRWSLYEEMAAKNANEVPKPIDQFTWWRDTVIGSIEPGELDVLAVDPISDIERGLADWVYENPDYFGHTKTQYDKGSGLMWGDVNSYWKTLLGVLSAKVKTFAFSTHMGLVWKDGKPVVGKLKAKGKSVLYELASLYLHLERKPDASGKVPAAPVGSIVPPLGKSRLAHTTIKDGLVETVPILPPRIEDCTPAKIREYIAKPPNYKNLKKSERAESQELTADERLELEVEKAEAERDAEQARLSRLEKMAQSAQQTRDRESQQAAEEGAAKAKAESESTGLPANGEAAKSKTVYETIAEQRAELKIPDAAWNGILKKRGVEKLKDLSAEEAEKLRKKLWSKLSLGK